MIIRVTLSYIFSVEVVSCPYIADMLLCCDECHVCVLCRLMIVTIIVYFMGGQLVFDWARLENLLITRD